MITIIDMSIYFGKHLIRQLINGFGYLPFICLIILVKLLALRMVLLVMIIILIPQTTNGTATVTVSERLVMDLMIVMILLSPMSLSRLVKQILYWAIELMTVGCLALL